MTLTLDEIRTKGLEALCRELGPDGMIRFLQQFDNGSGNYAKERHAWVDATSFDQIREAIKAKNNREKQAKKPKKPKK